MLRPREAGRDELQKEKCVEENGEKRVGGK